MKAIELTETGGPEVMHLREIPTPIPQESEVLIRVAVTGVNFIDLYVREGRYGNELPFTPGQEAAGTVVAVGKSISHLQEGDRVAWCSVLGTYAEYAVARLPNGSYRFRLVSPSNRRPPPCCKA